MAKAKKKTKRYRVGGRKAWINGKTYHPDSIVEVAADMKVPKGWREVEESTPLTAKEEAPAGAEPMSTAGKKAAEKPEGA